MSAIGNFVIIRRILQLSPSFELLGRGFIQFNMISSARKGGKVLNSSDFVIDEQNIFGRCLTQEKESGLHTMSRT